MDEFDLGSVGVRTGDLGELDADDPAKHVGRDLQATLILYCLCALGAVGLVAWGVYEKRKERVNLGVAGFAISVLFFYFDSFIAKLGRSLSLLILGVLCLAGGYALEMTRRKLMARMESWARAQQKRGCSWVWCSCWLC